MNIIELAKIRRKEFDALHAKSVDVDTFITQIETSFTENKDTPMGNYNERKQKILDDIAQLRTSKSEAVLQVASLRDELTKKAEELGNLDSLKQAVKSLPDTAYKVLPSGLKSVLGKFRG